MCDVSDKEAWFDHNYTDKKGLCQKKKKKKKLAVNTNVTFLDHRLFQEISQIFCNQKSFNTVEWNMANLKIQSESTTDVCQAEL